MAGSGNELVSVQPAETRGLGLYARVDLPAGSLLLTEPPLVHLTIPHRPATLAKFMAQLRSQVGGLEEDKRDQFFSLHIARPDLVTKDRGDLRMMGIYQANSLTISEQDKLKGRDLGSGVFPLSSRINHSCSPNCVLSFTAQAQCEVRCVRAVRAGEEILASYVSPLLSRAERQRLLAARYNFTCTCQVCGAPDQEVETNDRLRREILGLTNNMEDIFSTNPQKAFKYAKMKLERMDRLGHEVIEILPQTYLHCYELCLALGEQEIAEIFAVKGKTVAKLIRGNNSLWSQIK